MPAPAIDVGPEKVPLLPPPGRRTLALIVVWTLVLLALIVVFTPPQFSTQLLGAGP